MIQYIVKIIGKCDFSQSYTVVYIYIATQNLITLVISHINYSIHCLADVSVTFNHTGSKALFLYKKLNSTIAARLSPCLRDIFFNRLLKDKISSRKTTTDNNSNVS